MVGRMSNDWSPYLVVLFVPFLVGRMSNDCGRKLWQEKVVPRFSGTAPNAYTEGDIKSFSLYAGQSVGMVRDILPAGAVVMAMVEGAKSIIRGRLLGMVVV